MIHFGGTFTRENVKAFLEYTGVLEPYKDMVELPEECELCVKEKDGKQYLFILNYDKESKRIVVKNPVIELWIPGMKYREL